MISQSHSRGFYPHTSPRCKSICIGISQPTLPPNVSKTMEIERCNCGLFSSPFTTEPRTENTTLNKFLQNFFPNNPDEAPHLLLLFQNFSR